MEYSEKTDDDQDEGCKISRQEFSTFLQEEVGKLQCSHCSFGQTGELHWQELQQGKGQEQHQMQQV